MSPRDPGEPIILKRDTPATTVPHGQPVDLSEGGLVFLVQRLGGSFTVRSEMGTLLRVDGFDADALGLEPPEVPGAAPGSDGDAGPFSMEQVTAALHTVFDPEIPVSIVDLGLVYRCEEHHIDGRRHIDIDMTMTAPGCGMGSILQSDAARAVEAVPGVDSVDVNLVFDPPWSINSMTEEVRLELGLL